jgi:hypothetical protein
MIFAARRWDNLTVRDKLDFVAHSVNAAKLKRWNYNYYSYFGARPIPNNYEIPDEFSNISSQLLHAYFIQTVAQNGISR